MKETSMFRFFLLIMMFVPFLAGASLEVGDQAPDFALAGSDGNQYTLQQFRGQKPVVIAWFPKAFTGG
jgi:peroxiredoxin Q/BCP